MNAPIASRQLRVLLLVACATFAPGCGSKSSNPSSSAATKGTAGSTFTVRVNNPGSTGGTVVSGTLAADGVTFTADDKINCGGGSALCSADYPWGTTGLALKAITTQYFDGWFGDCSGTGGCQLSGNSEKYVVAVFSATPQSHPNFTDPAVHGPAYDAFAANPATAVLNCTNCHGATLRGQGIAPSCSSCHAWPLPAAGGRAYTIGGTISGLTGAGLVLASDGEPDLSVAAGARSFTFPLQLASATDYNVRVVQQPTNPSQTCSVANASGTVAAGDVTAVAVTCTTDASLTARSFDGACSCGQVRDALGNCADCSASLPCPVGLTCGGGGTPGRCGGTAQLNASFATAPPDPLLWCVNTSAGASVRWVTGRVIVSVPATSNAYADFYSVASFPVGTRMQATVNPSAAQWFDHKGIGFANSGVSADGGVGETDAVMWRGQDSAAFAEVKAAGALTTSVFVQPYATGWRTFAVARSSPFRAVIEDGSSSLAFQTTIPQGPLPVRFSAFTYYSGSPDAPITLDIGDVATTGLIPGTFAPTGTMIQARSWHSATLLANGKVLLAGGDTSATSQTAELYDSVIGKFASGGTMIAGRYAHTGTLLADGRVLIAGGRPAGSLTELASAEIFDPATGLFTPTSSMNMARFLHSATLLANGKVLIAGGYNTSIDHTLSSAELYDPATGRFRIVGNMGFPRDGHTATLLANGKVLITGGQDWGAAVGGAILSQAELFDPAAATFSPTGSMFRGRENHCTARLTDGRVLVLGGDFWDTRAALYEPATGTFQSIASTVSNRTTLPLCTALPGGQVLVAGGWIMRDNVGVIAPDAEIVDPVTATFSATGSMSTGRFGATATLLPNGEVLYAGGSSSDTAELYTPPW
jgi:hypothetical protein